jgi:hypothetical protein
MEPNYTDTLIEAILENKKLTGSVGKGEEQRLQSLDLNGLLAEFRSLFPKGASLGPLLKSSRYTKAQKDMLVRAYHPKCDPTGPINFSGK